MEIPQRDKKPNPLTRFGKWLFTKRRRWLTTIIILVIVVLSLIGFLTFRIHQTLIEIRAQSQEYEEFISDLKRLQEELQEYITKDR